MSVRVLALIVVSSVLSVQCTGTGSHSTDRFHPSLIGRPKTLRSIEATVQDVHSPTSEMSESRGVPPGQNTSTRQGIIDTAYKLLESHRLEGTRWGMVWRTLCPLVYSCAILYLTECHFHRFGAAVPFLPASQHQIQQLSMALGRCSVIPH